MTDSEAGIAFFVACINRLVVSASDYIDRTLTALNQATATKHPSTDDSVEQSPSIEPIDIEGLACMYICLPVCLHSF